MNSNIGNNITPFDRVLSSGSMNILDNGSIDVQQRLPQEPQLQEESLQEEQVVLPDEVVIGPRPKRPLSAYNLFFQNERKKMLAVMPIRTTGKPRRSHGKCGFADMAKHIAKKWNEDDIDPEERAQFEAQAKQEKLRYNAQMQEYKRKKAALKSLQQQDHTTTTAAAATTTTAAPTETTMMTMGQQQQQQQQQQQYHSAFARTFSVPTAENKTSSKQEAIMGGDVAVAPTGTASLPSFFFQANPQQHQNSSPSWMMSSSIFGNTTFQQQRQPSSSVLLGIGSHSLSALMEESHHAFALGRPSSQLALPLPEGHRLHHNIDRLAQKLDPNNVEFLVGLFGTSS